MLNERIRSLRKSKGLEAKFIASKLNISNSTYSGYESGRTKPSIEKLEELADFFEVSIDYLTGRSPIPNASYIEDLKEPDLDSDGLSPDEIELVQKMIDKIRGKKK